MPTLTQDSLASVFVQPHSDGRFEAGVRAHLAKLGAARPAVILAFPPKAAGTFFRAAMVSAVGGQLLRTVHAQGGRDAQFYLPTFVDYFSGGLTRLPMVSHVHMQALPANVHFMEAFGIKPVVMVRSIPDMLASYWDMLESDGSALSEGLNCLVPADFPELARAEKADFLIDIMGPWYASYFATWFAYAKAAPGRVCVLRYGEFRDDPAGTLVRATMHVGLTRTRAQCRAALDRTWAIRGECRYNRGEEGRGARYFAPEHIERLARMLRPYRHLAQHGDELLALEPSSMREAV
jgi:hypothetical protein